MPSSRYPQNLRFSSWGNYQYQTFYFLWVLDRNHTLWLRHDARWWFYRFIGCFKPSSRPSLLFCLVFVSASASFLLLLSIMNWGRWKDYPGRRCQPESRKYEQSRLVSAGFSCICWSRLSLIILLRDWAHRWVRVTRKRGGSLIWCRIRCKKIGCWIGYLWGRSFLKKGRRSCLGGASILYL